MSSPARLRAVPRETVTHDELRAATARAFVDSVRNALVSRELARIVKETQPPPFDADAEARVIGAVLAGQCSPRSLCLDAEHFFLTWHATLWAAALECKNPSDPHELGLEVQKRCARADPRLLVDELEKAHSFADELTTHDDLTRDAARVAELAELRGLLEAVDRVARAIRSEAFTVPEARAALAKLGR